MNRISAYFKSLLTLTHWSAIRHGYLIPAFTAIQILFSISIVYGFSLLLTEISAETSQYLSSGSWILGIIAVGCVLAPQITSSAKQAGLLDYQKTLPVPRSTILLSEIIIWNLAALPGIIAGILVSSLKFDITIHVDSFTVASIMLAQFTTISIGYTISFWLPQNISALLTQVIMIVALLFSPITFPSERLPEWASTIHNFLPFAPLAELIRESTFRYGDPQEINILVLLIWLTLSYSSAYYALKKRD